MLPSGCGILFTLHFKWCAHSSLVTKCVFCYCCTKKQMHSTIRVILFRSFHLLKAGEVDTRVEMTVRFFNKNETYEFRNQYTCIYCEFVWKRVAIKLHDGRKMRYGIHPVDFHGKSSVKSNITCHIAHTCVRYTLAICGNSIRVQQIAWRWTFSSIQLTYFTLTHSLYAISFICMCVFVSQLFKSYRRSMCSQSTCVFI